MAQPALPVQSMPEPPPAASALGFSILIALFTGLLLAVMGFQTALWQRDLQEASILIQARALADAAAQVDTSTDTGTALLKKTVEAMPQMLPELTEVAILEGTRFAAHTLPDLAGTRLQRDNLEHKALYDDSRALQDNLTRNQEELEKYPELTRNPFATSLARFEGGLLYVAVPMISGTEMRGIVAVKARPAPLPASPFALQLSLAGAGFILLAIVAMRVAPGTPRALIGLIYMGIMAGLVWYQVDTSSTLHQQRLGEAAASSFMVWKDLVAAAPSTMPVGDPTLEAPSDTPSEAVPADGVPSAVVEGQPPTDGATLPAENGAVAIPTAGEGQAPGAGSAVPSADSSASPVPPATLDPKAFLTVVHQGADGNAVSWFTEVSEGTLSGERRVTVGNASVQLSPTLQVDARWGWRGLAMVLAGMAGYLLLLATGRSRRMADAFLEHWYAYAYIAPAVVGTALLVFGPFVFGIVLGFYTRVYTTYEFVGFQNFIDILSDFQITRTKNFYRTLAVTVMWTGLNVSLHVSIGLGLAMILKDRTLRFTPIYRTLLVIPWALPNYITALIWKGMFNKEYGAVNTALAAMGIEPVSWFNSFWGAFTANLVTNVWLGFPFMMVISLGALQSIPLELYEAADVDGAGRWDKFWRITLPLLKPALFPAVILGTIWTFNQFNVIYLVSGGAPNNETDILITEAYRWAFEGRNQFGYAAAYSTIIFLILFGYTWVTNRITKSTEGAFA